MMICNHTIKILDRKQITAHHCHVVQKLNMLSFDSLINFASFKLIHKCPHNQAPQVLSDLMAPLRVSGSVTRGAADGNCEVHMCKSSFGQIALTCGILHLQSSNWILIQITLNSLKEDSVMQSWIMWCFLFCVANYVLQFYVFSLMCSVCTFIVGCTLHCYFYSCCWVFCILRLN